MLTLVVFFLDDVLTLPILPEDFVLVRVTLLPPLLTEVVLVLEPSALRVIVRSTVAPPIFRFRYRSGIAGLDLVAVEEALAGLERDDLVALAAPLRAGVEAFLPGRDVFRR